MTIKSKILLPFLILISTFLLTIPQFGLYATYYLNYLQNLFLIKNRLTDLKSIFPISLLTKLKLNDRLKIRDKRYIINSFKTNLTSGEVDLLIATEAAEAARAVGNGFITPDRTHLIASTARA